MSGKLKNNLLIVTILLAAFALRVIAIDQVPPGLSHDEAYNGVTARQVLAGQHRLFFEINKGIEPLIIYLEAAAFYFFGVGPVQLRLVNVFCGLLTVALVYPLTRRLFNRRVALLAMAGLAVSFWAIFVSRLTLRAVTLPPLLLLTLYFLWRGLAPPQKTALRLTDSQHSYPFLGLSGLAAGATMYTYLSSRFLPFIIMAVFGAAWWGGRLRRAHWGGAILLFVVWGAVFAPLAAYYVENLQSFTRRSDQVTTIPYALNGEFGPTIESTRRTLGMFTFYGDETDRYNLDGRPIFDWINGAFFYVGLGWLLLGLRRGPARAGPALLLWAWLFFMLLPDFVTDDSPHFLRTIGALPPVIMAWALGLETALGWLARFWQKPFLQPALVGLVLVGTTLHTTYDYFGRWVAAPEARFIYGADIAQIAAHLKQTPDEAFPTISAEYFRDLDPFRSELHFAGEPPFTIWFDGRQSLAFPPPQSGLRPRYFFSAGAPAATLWQPFLQPVDLGPAVDYQLYHLADAATLQQAWAETFAAAPPLQVNLNDDLLLLNHRLLGEVVNGGRVQLVLGWQALRTLPPETDYTFVARLVDQAGQIWAEADGNGYAPGDWQPGVLGLQLLTLRLPSDLPPRGYSLIVEVVNRQTGQPLPTAAGEMSLVLQPVVSQLSSNPREPNPETMPTPIEVPLPLSSGALTLRGYSLNQTIFRAGERLIVTLHWQVRQTPPAAYQVQLFLQPEQTSAVAEVIYPWAALEPINGEWPTEQWPAGYWVQDRLEVVIGGETPPGVFRLLGRWVEPDSGQPASPPFDLGQINFEATN